MSFCSLTHPLVVFELSCIKSLLSARRIPPYYSFSFGEPLRLTTTDEVTLHCMMYESGREISHWLDPTEQETKGCVIIFHGNGMIISEMNAYIYRFWYMGYDVIAAEYRGYGLSTGFPTEEGLRIDAQTVLDHVLSDPVRSKRPIIIFGQSLGGAVAIDLVSRNNDKVSALILENTFTSVSDVIKGWGFIGYFSFLCPDKWPSADRMALISDRIPILLLSGTADNIIPPWQMAKLRDIANERGFKASNEVEGPSTPQTGEKAQVRFELLEGYGHNGSVACRKYWDHVEGFIKDSSPLRTGHNVGTVIR